MSSMKSIGSGAVMLVASVALTAGAAQAGAQVGGGDWDFGHGVRDVWSNYYHPTKTHASSVKRDATLFASGCTAKDKRSYASVGASWWTTVSEYYNFC